jgi:hypothetical protein
VFQACTCTLPYSGATLLLTAGTKYVSSWLNGLSLPGNASMLEWADYMPGANALQGKQRPLARYGLLPVSFSCCHIRALVEGTALAIVIAIEHSTNQRDNHENSETPSCRHIHFCMHRLLPNWIASFRARTASAKSGKARRG